MIKIQTVVIGAGIIGLAIARQLALSGHKVLVVEANPAIGQETSFRNSAVIHAGIYYPQESHKAILCRQGKKLLYDYCAMHSVPHQRIGKLIVATSTEQTPELHKLHTQAIANRVEDIQWLTAHEVQKLEPQVRCVAALYSSSTGIVDGKQLLLAYKKDLESNGGTIFYNTRIISGKVNTAGFLLTALQKNSQQNIACEYLINAGGLWAQEIAHSIQEIPSESIPAIYYAKGNYFKYLGKAPFVRLVYPIPEQAGLGIHATLDMAGNMRFGPDVEWIDTIDYSVTKQRKADFLRAIQTYLPDIKDEQLIAEFAGVRPKIKPAGQQPQDFMLQSYREHGIPNLINLYGIESPGLTCSLAIGEYVARVMLLTR